jgi:hypothetical protein
MVRLVRGLLILAVLAGLLGPNRLFGQSTLPPTQPASENLPLSPRVLDTPTTDGPTTLPNVPPTVPASYLAPSAVVPDGPPQETGVLGPPGQWNGWFVNIDGALINPHIDSHLNSGSNIKAPFLTPSTPTSSVQTSLPPGSNANVFVPFGSPITLPIAALNWVGSPFVRVGYRFANGAGDVRLDWRMVASQGNDTIPNFDPAGDGLLRSRLNVQYASLTYGASEFLTNAPQIDRTWMARFGVSAADVFFDSQARGQVIQEQRASNSFGGVGPTVGFQFWKPLAKSRISLYGELDATGLVGFTRQHFSETVLLNGQSFSDTEALRRQSNGVGIFGTEGGFSYAPWDERIWRFTFGYQWQRWWWVGATSDSNAALTLQGFFFRTEWRY